MIPGPITSVAQLLDVLPGCSNRDFLTVVRSLDLPLERFEPYLHWEPGFYTRNCLVRTEAYELVLLCWEPGQDTPIHCHDQQECWVYVVDGRVEEKRFELQDGAAPVHRDTEVRSTGQFSYMTDAMGVHSLHNTAPGRSASLHLYVKPIEKCQVFDPLTGEATVRQLSYYSYEGKVVEPVS